MRFAGEGEAGAEQLLRQGRAWVVRLMSGSATMADLSALEYWRGQSAAHEAAFADAVRLRRRMERAYRGLVDAQAAEPVRAWRRPAPRRQMGRRLVLGGAMAAAAGYLVAQPPFNLWPDLAELEAKYRTTTGEQRAIAFTDHVVFDLNTRTSIADRSTASAYRVELIAGEAKIAAALDDRRSLTVLAATGRTVASQATFNVRYEDGEVCVTCIDGTAKVESRHGVVVLAAQQQVSYSDQNLGAIVVVDPALVTAWQSGLLIFQDTPLTEVIREVNRYRRGRIILANEKLGRRTVDGVFHIDRIDGVIDQLRKLGAQVRFLPAGMVLVS